MDLETIFNYVNEETIKSLNIQLNQMEEKEQELRALMADSEKRNEELQVQLEEERMLNAGLKRIMRERSNAARDIKPKKEHDGYIVLRSEQYLERSDDAAFAAWRTALQTPYPAELDFRSACLAVETDLFARNIAEELGCEKLDLDCDTDELSGSESNTLYRILYKADIRSGFWEATVFTTGPLYISKDRFPRSSRMK